MKVDTERRDAPIRSKIACVCLYLVLTIALAGCATILSKSQYSFSLKANEPDTIVKVYDRDGAFVKEAKAPSTIELDADAGMFSRASYRFVFEKPGFETVEGGVTAQVDPYYWLNFITTPSMLLGLLLVDPISGAMWSFDENVTISGFLQPKSCHEPVQGDVEADPQEHQAPSRTWAQGERQDWNVE